MPNDLINTLGEIRFGGLGFRVSGCLGSGFMGKQERGFEGVERGLRGDSEGFDLREV